MAEQDKNLNSLNKAIKDTQKSFESVKDSFIEGKSLIASLKAQKKDYDKHILEMERLYTKESDEYRNSLAVGKKIDEQIQQLQKNNIKNTEEFLEQLEKQQRDELKTREKILTQESQYQKHIQTSGKIGQKLAQQHQEYVQEFLKSLGIENSIVKGMTSKNKNFLEVLNASVIIGEKRNEIDRNRIEQIRKNWYLEATVGSRLASLAKSKMFDLKDSFLNKTGILGDTIKFFGKVAGKNLGAEGRVGGQEEIERMKRTSELINAQTELAFTERTLAEAIKQMVSKQEVHEIKKEEREEKATEAIITKKDNKESGGMRNENKDKGFVESVKQTKLLKKILEKKQSMSGFGLGGLLAVGGLLGYLLFGESRHLKELMKGFLKFEQLGKFFNVGEKLERLGKSMKALADMKYIKILEKLPTGVLKILEKLQAPIKGLGKLMKGIGSLGKFIPMLGTIGKLGTFAKLGLGFLKKIPGLGAIVGIILGVQKWKRGDKLGAVMEFGSGLASLFPGVGTAVSIALDLASFFRDNKLEKDALQSSQLSSSGKPSKPIKGFAKGGIAWNKQLAWVAEEGPEKITPLNQKQDISSNIQSYASNVTKNPTEIQTIKLHKDSITELAKQMQKGFGSELNKNGQFTAKDTPSGSLK